LAWHVCHVMLYGAGFGVKAATCGAVPHGAVQCIAGSGVREPVPGVCVCVCVCV